MVGRRADYDPVHVDMLTEERVVEKGKHTAVDKALGCSKKRGSGGGV